MIIEGSILNVADNSGAKRVACIRVLKSKKFAKVGDIIKVSVKKAIRRGNAVSGGVYYAVLVRTRKGYPRSDGSCVSFDDNAVVLLNEKKDFMGSRVFGAVDAALRKRGMTKVVSLASEVV